MREHRTHRLRLRFAIAIFIASAAIPLSISSLTTPEIQKAKHLKPRPTMPRLLKLRSVDQLKEMFERDTGKVRLVALVSPT